MNYLLEFILLLSPSTPSLHNILSAKAQPCLPKRDDYGHISAQVISSKVQCLMSAHVAQFYAFSTIELSLYFYYFLFS